VRVAALLLAGLTLASCQPAPRPDNTREFELKVGPITSAAELDGMYRVAELADIDMAELDRGVSVSIVHGRIDVLLQCVNVHWDIRFEGERLITRPVEDHEPCRRAQMPEEAVIQDAFDHADRVSRTPSNGISFEGSGSSVTLFTQ
jgi:hypothetical protein